MFSTRFPIKSGCPLGNVCRVCENDALKCSARGVVYLAECADCDVKKQMVKITKNCSDEHLVQDSNYHLDEQVQNDATGNLNEDMVRDQDDYLNEHLVQRSNDYLNG